MKVEIGRFYDGDLKVLIRFEPSSNFWKETLTWVPTIKEIELILNTLLGIDVINRWKKYRKDGRYREQGNTDDSPYSPSLELREK